MEKTIKCPDCGDDVIPEYKRCPICGYKFTFMDFKSADIDEKELDGRSGEIKFSPATLGKIKVIAFLAVLFIIVFFFFSR